MKRQKFAKTHFLHFSLNSFCCLHPNGLLNDTRINNELSSDDPPKLLNDDLPTRSQFYYVWNSDNTEPGEKDIRASLGLGDFFIFNLMLLTVLPSLSSMTTKVCVTIGHIIAVQIGQEATFQLGCLYNQCTQPALPLPVVAVSIYAILLNSFIEY